MRLIATLIASSAAMVSASALAQSSGAGTGPKVLPAPPPFAMNEAARCAVVYAQMLDALQSAPNVPSHIRRGFKDALAVWEYELSRSSPGAGAAVLQKAANDAAQAVHDDLPKGDTSDAAQARGTFLQESAATCASKITIAYDRRVHPVIPYLRKAEVAVEPGVTGTATTSAPISASEGPKSQAPSAKRSLR
ncbi:hypothetical protein [Parvularcula sp. LCG005]|uniref:hypothetical protein n=1 Tax=Parvularcula sp. LCG005 TaxID=3078805 RepID=UPI0029434BE9|nr:hypothetical protein [Parvularcula sp. LCG005]WOI53127.1 hypothetical protein RUI03_13335 [Parvularcula sp. LCG005]